MIRRLSLHLVSSSIAYKAISDDDKELYTFAYEAMLWHLLNWLTALVLGLVWGCLLEAVLYMFMLIPLRIYSGGFHLSSYSVCYIGSTVLFSGVMMLCKNAQQLLSGYALLPVYIISFIIIVLLSPIGDPNKPLDDSEIKKYHKYAVRILVLETVIFCIMFFKEAGLSLLVSVAAAPVMVAALLVISVAKSHLSTVK